MKKVKRIELFCSCGKSKEFTEKQILQLWNERSYKCRSCTNSDIAQRNKEKSSLRMKHTLSLMTKEQRSNNARKARANHKTSQQDILKKQHATIKADPERYKQYCAKRSKIASNFHSSLSDAEKQHHYEKIFKGQNVSNNENSFFDVLEKNGICAERYRCIGGLFPDGIFENEKLIIEYFGDMFHCNPKKFEEKTQYCSWLSRTVEEQWANDKKRIAIFWKFGYKTLIIWESDWFANQQIQIERIKNEMSKYRIY